MPNNHSTLSSLIVKDRLQQLKSSISTKPLGQSFYKSSAKGWEQTQKETLKHGGVYAFWWATKTDYFRRLINRSNGVKLYGKQLNGKPLPVNIQINEQWLEDATHNGAILLYVGRSTNIGGRLNGHIKPQTDRLEKSSKDSNRKPNTVSQLRFGLERLLGIEDARSLIMNHVHFSFVKLDTYDESVNRFYLENLAIGQLLPIFNLDVER